MFIEKRFVNWCIVMLKQYFLFAEWSCVACILLVTRSNKFQYYLLLILFVLEYSLWRIYRWNDLSTRHFSMVAVFSFQRLRHVFVDKYIICAEISRSRHPQESLFAPTQISSQFTMYSTSNNLGVKLCILETTYILHHYPKNKGFVFNSL